MISMGLKVLIIIVVLAVVMTRKTSKPILNSSLNSTLPANETPYIWDIFPDIGKLMKDIQTLFCYTGRSRFSL